MSHFDYNNQEKLAQLERIAATHVDQIYDYFDAEISYRNENIIKSSCFIHGGDNPTSLNLYPNGDIRVHYKCRTHGCEEIFGTSLISMVRGALSTSKYKWRKKGDREATFNQAVEFLLKITGQKFNDLDEDKCPNLEKLRFSTMINKLYSDATTEGITTKDQYLNTVEIPAEYYLERGYSKETLEFFGIGFCDVPGKQMYQRAIVPIYDDKSQYVVGVSGRSIFGQCSKCNFYHDPKKPCKFFPKWRHSKGFQKEKWLYNYCNAQPNIRETQTIVIVESPGNVWRLHEAGVRNAVAIFGTALNDNQKAIIDASGALSLVLLMDNDDAGQRASAKIKDTCEKLYAIYQPKIIKNDIGDMSIKEIRDFIIPTLNQIMEKYE